MRYTKYPTRDARKNYFLVPNEVFDLGLNYREIAVYSFLLRCENRETYQCWPSYTTIGQAIGMSANTVCKYVCSLEEKGFIRTEPTQVRYRDGRKMNGTLRYTILPIQQPINANYDRQFRQLDEAKERQRLAAQLNETDHREENADAG